MLSHIKPLDNNNNNQFDQQQIENKNCLLIQLNKMFKNGQLAEKYEDEKLNWIYRQYLFNKQRNRREYINDQFVIFKRLKTNKQRDEYLNKCSTWLKHRLIMIGIQNNKNQTNKYFSEKKQLLGL